MRAIVRRAAVVAFAVGFMALVLFLDGGGIAPLLSRSSPSSAAAFSFTPSAAAAAAEATLEEPIAMARPRVITNTEDKAKASTSFELQHLSKEVSQMDLAGPHPDNAAATCELYFLANEACARHQSMLKCARHFGCSLWAEALPPKCTDSAFWKDKVMPKCGHRDGAHREAGEEVELLLDRVTRAKLPRLHRQKYVPVRDRSFSTLAGPVMCPFGPVYRYGYFIPASNIAGSVAPKIWDWLEALPPVYPGVEAGDGPIPFPRVQFPFEADDEATYALALQHSYFAWSIERTGVNTVRTMEILSQGSVPYYPDYDRCSACLSQLPKQLLEEALALPGVAHIGRVSPNKSTSIPHSHPFFFTRRGFLNVKTAGTIDWALFNTTAYNSLARRLLHFTQAHLSCAAGMASLLRFIAYEDPRSVLHLVRPNETLPGNNGVCGLDELGINYTRNVATLEHRGSIRYPSRHRGETLGRAFARRVYELGIHFMYAHGFSFSQRMDDPPNPPLLPGWDSDHRSCASHLGAANATVHGAYDVVMFAGTVPSPESIPCYGAVIEALRHGAIARFVVLDVGDKPQQAAVVERLVRDGVHVFAVNEPRC